MNENHYAAIRRTEGYAAEMRARAADAGLPYEEPSSKSDLERVLELLGTIADPAAMKKRLSEHLDACNKATADANAAVEASKATIAEHDKRRVAEVAALAADRAQFEKERSGELQEIKTLKAETVAMNDRARAFEASNKQKAEDLDRRMTLLRQAGL